MIMLVKLREVLMKPKKRRSIMTTKEKSDTMKMERNDIARTEKRGSIVMEEMIAIDVAKTMTVPGHLGIEMMAPGVTTVINSIAKMAKIVNAGIAVK